MKLSVTYFPEDLHHPAVKALVGDAIATKECPWGSELSERYLTTFSGLSGCAVRLSFSFTDKQCEQYSHFILKPKHVIRETDAVSAANAAHSEQAPVIREDEFGVYRARSKVFVAAVKPQADRIWAMEYSESYLVATQWFTLMLERFSGFNAIPVLHYKTSQVVDGWHSFSSSHWLDRLVIDDSVELAPGRNGKKIMRPLGLLAASANDLKSLPDIARCPGANSSGDSLYIVNQSAWQCWRECGINSFWPYPLLNEDSQHYQRYRALIDDVRSRIAIHSANVIRM